ncbi:uncharacterized protein ACRADG_006162 [Cochliomyia hominivorax]
MFNFKLILLMVVVVPAIFAYQIGEVENQPLSDVIPDNGDVEVKINWGPVWDDQEGHNEFVTKTTAEDPQKDAQNCAAPNGLGLSNLFIQVDKILPKEQIKSIINFYSEDPEIKALRAFVQSPQTLEKLKAIQNSLDYKILKDYSCHVLHINLGNYNRLARILLRPTLERAANGKGVRGLINEVDAILPRQELRALYQNLLASDEELVKAVANLKSEKFHQLLLNVRNNVPEYKEITNQLRALGVPIDEMRELFANTLGWAPEMGVLV